MPFDIGIDLGGTNVKMGLVDRQGRGIARQLLPTRARSGPIPALERVAAAVAELKRGRRVASVGIGVAGLVDHINGIVRVPPNLPGWNGTPVKDILGRLTGIPVFCANDVTRWCSVSGCTGRASGAGTCSASRSAPGSAAASFRAAGCCSARTMRPVKSATR